MLRSVNVRRTEHIAMKHRKRGQNLTKTIKEGIRTELPEMKHRKRAHDSKTKTNSNGIRHNVTPSQLDLASTEDETKHDKDNIFPDISPWILYVVTLLIRVRYISRNENNWLYHHDEIYQGVEGTLCTVILLYILIVG